MRTASSSTTASKAALRSSEEYEPCRERLKCWSWRAWVSSWTIVARRPTVSSDPRTSTRPVLVVVVGGDPFPGQGVARRHEAVLPDRQPEGPGGGLVVALLLGGLDGLVEDLPAEVGVGEVLHGDGMPEPQAPGLLHEAHQREDPGVPLPR